MNETTVLIFGGWTWDAWTGQNGKTHLDSDIYTLGGGSVSPGPNLPPGTYRTFHLVRYVLVSESMIFSLMNGSNFVHFFSLSLYLTNMTPKSEKQSVETNCSVETAISSLGA